ncbi:hypothetical protein JZM24_14275 [Candidatus Sodalis endolongispinus]|uniref:Uncharacterized protein n=1 Tax=Candidatus Sodalis endolongispinus TaxID=2812662 RepID=A0ABS5YDB9_9GAMM|nr:YebF family protein [Candidatus Sodalis endolongispinus]MBT9433006.1 hypothetical protein [Candidatus Sodalis endolongispinus]
MGKTGNRVAGMLVAWLLVSSMTARADDTTPTPVPAQDNAGVSTPQATGETPQPVTPPAANAPQNQGENTAAPAGNANAAGATSAQGNANATGTAATPNGSADTSKVAPTSGNANATGTAAAPNGNADAATTAPASGNAGVAAPDGNARAGNGVGRQEENTGAAKGGAQEPVTAEKRAAAKKTASDKAAADKSAKAKSAKPGAAAGTPEIAKVSPCTDLNAPQVAELVVQDYTQNRFQRSAQNKQAAGGSNINAWVNPEDVTGVGDVWQAPLKVCGNAQDLNFAVTLDCTKGEITYRLNQ